jgi:AMP nucleosidase
LPDYSHSLRNGARHSRGRIQPSRHYSLNAVSSPPPVERRSFDDAREAVAALKDLYDRNTGFLRTAFSGLPEGEPPDRRFRAYYPELAFTTTSFSHADSRLAYGHMPAPGHYATTVTRPDLFEDYLLDQIALVLRNHGVPVTVGESETPIPIHFAFLEGTHLPSAASLIVDQPLRDLFDVPDLNATDDHIVNGTFEPLPGEPTPLAPFTAQRIDYSLHRLAHYTATSPSHFQNFVLFTNYQFYIDEFCILCAQADGRRRRRIRQLHRAGQRRHRAGESIDPDAAAGDAPAADAGLSSDQSPAIPASPWSISASAPPTPRRSPTISPCCARMHG